MTTPLDALEARLAQDLRLLDVPAPSWVPPTDVVSARVLHSAAPGGGIWLAFSEGTAIGTIMLKGLPEAGDCEMKRLVVRASARGLGVGRALVDRLVSEARLRGYRRLLLDTGIEHHEAMKLYRSLGFVERSAYYDVPADLASMLVFFEGDLEALSEQAWQRRH